MLLRLTDSPLRLDTAPGTCPLVRRALALLGLDYEDAAGALRGGALAEPEAAEHIAVTSGSLPPLPAHAVRLGRQGRVAAYRAGETALLLRSGAAAAAVLGAEARLVVEPLARTSDVAAVLALAVFLLLEQRGFVPLHAAALDCDGAGVLLVGPSDAGKSTLAYLLVRAGWRYLSDDSVLLRRTGAGVEAWTFRRRFGMDAEAGVLFPELVPYARTVAAAAGDARLADAGKWSVAIDAARPGRFTPCTRPRLIVFPRLEPGRPSRTGEAGRAEAFVRVRAQMALRGLSAAWTRAHEALAGALAQQAAAVHLRAGRDLLAQTSRADALLRPLLHLTS